MRGVGAKPRALDMGNIESAAPHPCGPPPPHAVDIVARPSCAKDPSCSGFDVTAMPARLRPYLPVESFECVLADINSIIEERARTGFSPSSILRALVLVATFPITLDLFHGYYSHGRLDEECEEVLKRWEQYRVITRFHKGCFQGDTSTNGDAYTIRVFLPSAGMPPSPVKTSRRD